jgi:leader peptidase (prepilin peptidase) / N-methyltransferase
VVSSAALLVVLFVGGLLVGSFLNVVIARVPEGKSIVRPGSHCPRCGHALSWYENVPLLSWAVLRGRCRNCRAPISIRYPAVELTTGLLFLAAGWIFGPGWPLLRVLLLIGFLVPLALIDLEHWVVPVEMTLLGTAAGLLSAIPLGLPVLEECAIGAAAGFLAFWAFEPASLLVVKILRRLSWYVRLAAFRLTRSHPSLDAALRLVGGALVGGGAGWLLEWMLEEAYLVTASPWLRIAGLLLGLGAGLLGLLRARRAMGEAPPERTPDPEEAFGAGDKWLLLLVGAFLGWRPLLGVLLLSSVQGAVGGITLLLLHGRAASEGPPPGSPATEDGWAPERTALPYGPWIALAAVELALLGPWLAETFPSPLVAVVTGQPWVPP